VEAINFFSDEFGYRRVDRSEVPELQKKSVKEVMKILGISIVQLPRIAYKAKKRIRAHVGSLDPVSGIAEVLQVLKNQGLRLGILTSNSEENVREFLKLHQLEFFEFVYADSSVFGKASVLKRLLKELQLTSKQVMYIGDETRDIQAARSLAVQVISVAWGYNARVALEAENPDYLIDDPHELAALFNSLMG
jgi:phosphoglycolate phosphatase